MTTPDAAPPAEPDEPPLRILLVEDDEFDVAVFRQAFRKAQIPCEVVRCRRGEEVLEGLRDAELAIDLLVTDHQLPGMSGFDLCVRLLEDAPPFALVLLTGAGSEQMAIRALRAGIQDYIVKDASQEYLDLLPLVLPRVARRHRDRRGRGRDRAPGAPPPPRLVDCAARVRQRGGRVWVENADGAAPTLCFSVPLAPEEVAAWAAPGPHLEKAGPEAPPQSSSAAGAHPPVRVLIVHPNPIVTHVARRHLERSGCRFLAVTDGHKALEALEREAFDLVLMGAGLPELDGLETTRRIRRREASSGGRVPIVALGADPDNGEDAACLEAGMDDVIVRPVDATGLAAALARAAGGL